MTKKRKAAAPAPAADTRPVSQRGTLWQPEKLRHPARVHKRATCPAVHRWTYEVKWKGAHRNIYEPAEVHRERAAMSNRVGV